MMGFSIEHDLKELAEALRAQESLRRDGTTREAKERAILLAIQFVPSLFNDMSKCVLKALDAEIKTAKAVIAKRLASSK